MKPSPPSANTARPGLIAAPMHGEVKLRSEGLRTRDGHMLEWFSRLRPDLLVQVNSRPEPWPRVTLARRGSSTLPPTLVLSSPQPRVIPSLRNRRLWWLTSLRYRQPWPANVPAIVWNPIEAAAAIRAGEATSGVVIDLLDDWTVHSAFAAIRQELESAYRDVFARADHVVANSEGTSDLARRFGRDDVELIANGVDPGRFAGPHVPGEKLTIGYGGKIGFRLDVDLVREAAASLPQARFEFVGPVLDRSVGRQLKRIPNVHLTGDVHYDRYPMALRGWDLAWAPHRLGDHEVGGDLIKLYEYRAAGLPTFSTRVIGWQRALEGVRALERSSFVAEMTAFVGTRHTGDIPREPIELPEALTWRSKAERLLSLAGLQEHSAPGEPTGRPR